MWLPVFEQTSLTHQCLPFSKENASCWFAKTESTHRKSRRLPNSSHRSMCMHVNRCTRNVASASGLSLSAFINSWPTWSRNDYGWTGCPEISHREKTKKRKVQNDRKVEDGHGKWEAKNWKTWPMSKLKNIEKTSIKEEKDGHQDKRQSGTWFEWEALRTKNETKTPKMKKPHCLKNELRTINVLHIACKRKDVEMTKMARTRVLWIHWCGSKIMCKDNHWWDDLHMIATTIRKNANNNGANSWEEHAHMRQCTCMWLQLQNVNFFLVSGDRARQCGGGCSVLHAGKVLLGGMLTIGHWGWLQLSVIASPLFCGLSICCVHARQKDCWCWELNVPSICVCQNDELSMVLVLVADFCWWKLGRQKLWAKVSQLQVRVCIVWVAVSLVDNNCLDSQEMKSS